MVGLQTYTIRVNQYQYQLNLIIEFLNLSFLINRVVLWLSLNQEEKMKLSFSLPWSPRPVARTRRPPTPYPFVPRLQDIREAEEDSPRSIDVPIFLQTDMGRPKNEPLTVVPTGDLICANREIARVDVLGPTKRRGGQAVTRRYTI